MYILACDSLWTEHDQVMTIDAHIRGINEHVIMDYDDYADQDGDDNDKVDNDGVCDGNAGNLRWQSMQQHFFKGVRSSQTSHHWSNR